jgi:hypothetical protein
MAAHWWKLENYKPEIFWPKRAVIMPLFMGDYTILTRE